MGFGTALQVCHEASRGFIGASHPGERAAVDRAWRSHAVPSSDFNRVLDGADGGSDFGVEGGELVEAGTHEALVALGGLYSELFQLQAAGYR